jgi:hypothetical protein
MSCILLIKEKFCQLKFLTNMKQFVFIHSWRNMGKDPSSRGGTHL